MQLQVLSQEITIFPIKVRDVYVISVTRYYYPKGEKKISSSETTWRWICKSPEMITKLSNEKMRTKAFTQQLMVLAKQFGEREHIKYKINKNKTNDNNNLLQQAI